MFSFLFFRLRNKRTLRQCDFFFCYRKVDGKNEKTLNGCTSFLLLKINKLFCVKTHLKRLFDEMRDAAGGKFWHISTFCASFFFVCSNIVETRKQTTFFFIIDRENLMTCQTIRTLKIGFQCKMNCISGVKLGGAFWKRQKFVHNLQFAQMQSDEKKLDYKSWQSVRCIVTSILKANSGSSWKHDNLPLCWFVMNEEFQKCNSMHFIVWTFVGERWQLGGISESFGRKVE